MASSTPAPIASANYVLCFLLEPCRLYLGYVGNLGEKAGPQFHVLGGRIHESDFRTTHGSMVVAVLTDSRNSGRHLGSVPHLVMTVFNVG